MSLNINRPITPEAFWHVFKEILHENIHDKFEEIITLYKNDDTWTSYILNLLEEKCGRAMGFSGSKSVAREFYRLDLSFYSYSGPCVDKDNEWNLEVAIEHENNAGTWMEEIVKLSHIQCGLRVLIAYYDYNAGESGLVNKLADAAKIITTRKYSDNNPNWLLIFGDLSANTPPIKYCAWQLFNNSFVSMEQEFCIQKKE